jgi:hypothetical protein
MKEHLSHMKKTLKRTGAIGLAAATIVTGLSFGPAAVAAPSPSRSAAIGGSTTAVSGAIVDAPATPAGALSDWVTVKFTGRDLQGLGYFTAPTNTTIEAAEVRHSRTDDVSEDKTGRITVASDKKSLVSAGVGSSGDNMRWGTDDHYLAVKLRISPTAIPNSTLTGGNMKVQRAAQYGGAVSGNQDFSIKVVGLSARVDSVDIPNRTAQVTGTAVPNSYIVVGTEIPDQVQAGTDGTWSYQLTGLKLGSNPVTFEQYEGTVKTGETTIDAELKVAPVKGAVSFPADNDQDAVLSGTAQPGATVVIRDVDGAEIARTEARLGSGTWSTSITAPNAGGDYDVRVHQEIDDEATGEIIVTATYGAAVQITAPVNDAAHDGGPVTLRGTGETGAQVAVREEGHQAILGYAEVLVSGEWTIRTTNVDDRKHVLEVTQTGKGNNTTVSTVTLNPENGEQPPVIIAPTVETPEAGSTVTTSRPVFSGHGQDGATISIGYGPNSIIGTGTVVDGAWSITPNRGLSLGTSNLIVTQTAGDDVQSINHSINRVAAELPLLVTSHVNDQFYDAGVTTFRGTAPIGSAVTAKNQWGTPMGEATAADGTWAFNRNLGPTTAGYLITFTATPQVGTPQVVTLKLNYANVVAFQVTSPTHNSTYTEGTTTFRGTAAPQAAITAKNQWGTSMGSTAANLQGAWSFNRYLGPTSAGYDISFVATKGNDVQRQLIHLDYRATNVPVAVTSIADGDTYRPGMNVLKGTGTPGATVRAVNATNNWNVPMGEAKVDTDGNWALPERNWGPANDYAIKVTQTNPDRTTTETTVNVKAPRFAPLVLTSPAVGDTYTNGVAATFTGTATPFATVTVSSATSSTVYREVQADAQGNWSFSRAWGPSHNYTLNIAQKALDGQTGDPITGFAWNHSGN